MKAYLLAFYNFIKCFCIKLTRNNFEFYPVQLLGRNTRLVIEKSGRVHLGKHIVSDGRLVIVVDKNAELFIGDGVYFNENVMISCKKNIKIDSGCKFGPNVKVFDNDHKFDAERGVGEEHTSAAISIGKNCWIATNCVILKGTTIGDNCVIGAGVIAHGTIPASSIVTASRDICIRPIEEREE